MRAGHVATGWRRAALGACLAAIAALLPTALATASTSVEQACFDKIQDKIAWSYEGDKHWSPENLSRLCRGTSIAGEPGLCFSRVMHGGISHGAGTRWEWQNALSLCSGTSDAERTIACFQKSLGHTGDWQASIQECRTRPALELPTGSGTQVELPETGSSPVVGTIELPGGPWPASELPTPPGVEVDDVLQVTSSCESWEDLVCTVFMIHNEPCNLLCLAEPCADPCGECIEGAFTAGVDCHRCLFDSVCGGGGGAGAGTTGTKVCGHCLAIDNRSTRGLRACSFFKGGELISSGTEVCQPLTQD
jgi:hypothetical protein